MGQDKANMRHPDGRTLLGRTLELMEDCCEKCFVSLRHDQEIPDEWPVSLNTQILRDPVDGSAGPMSGMLIAMKTAPNNTWLVVSCDLPRLDPETLRHLIGSLQTGETFLAYRSEFDGLPEPLCALYASGASVLLEEAQRQNFCCPRKVLIRNDCRLLEPVTRRALENANTPEDWKLALMP